MGRGAHLHRAPVGADDLADGFAVTGFFLLRHIFEPRRLALPDARASFISTVLNTYRTIRVAS